MPIANNQLEDRGRVLSEDVTPPSTGANKGVFFPKDVGGVTEAFFKDDQGREVQITANGSVSGSGGGGGGSSTFDGLTDVVFSNLTNNQFIQWDGSSWVNVTGAGGSGDLLASNNLSDIANAPAALSNLGGEPSLPVGAASQYLRGNKTLGNFSSDVSANASVVANTSKVSASSSVGTHSDVSLSGINVGDLLQWTVAGFVPASLPGGGDLLSTNNLSDVDNPATALSNINGLAKASNLSDVNNPATALSNINGLSKANIVTQAEAEAGISNTARAWTARRVKQAIDALASSGGGGAVTAGSITIPTAGSLATRLSNATGLPAGWSLIEGNNGSVHPSLSNFGATAGDVVLLHNSGKPMASVRITKDIGGIIQQADFNPSTGELLESVDLNQILFKSYESGGNAGTGTSIMTVIIPV